MLYLFISDIIFCRTIRLTSYTTLSHARNPPECNSEFPRTDLKSNPSRRSSKLTSFQEKVVSDDFETNMSQIETDMISDLSIIDEMEDNDGLFELIFYIYLPSLVIFLILFLSLIVERLSNVWVVVIKFLSRCGRAIYV